MGHGTFWMVAILSAIHCVGASVVWNLAIVTDLLVLKSRVIVFCDGCGRRLYRVDGENPQSSGLGDVCSCGFCRLLVDGSVHRRCLGYDFGVASDLWACRRSHPHFCEAWCRYLLQAWCDDVTSWNFARDVIKQDSSAPTVWV